MQILSLSFLSCHMQLDLWGLASVHWKLSTKVANLINMDPNNGGGQEFLMQDPWDMHTCKKLSVLLGSLSTHQICTHTCWLPYTYLCIWCLGPRNYLWYPQVLYHNWRPPLPGSHLANHATTNAWEMLSHANSPDMGTIIVKIPTALPNIGKCNEWTGGCTAFPPQGPEDVKTSFCQHSPIVLSSTQLTCKWMPMLLPRYYVAKCQGKGVVGSSTVRGKGGKEGREGRRKRHKEHKIGRNTWIFYIYI